MTATETSPSAKGAIDAIIGADPRLESVGFCEIRIGLLRGASQRDHGLQPNRIQAVLGDDVIGERSLGIQQLLPGQFLAEASYVGNRGTRLG